jgi:hypothetical protein
MMGRLNRDQGSLFYAFQAAEGVNSNTHGEASSAAEPTNLRKSQAMWMFGLASRPLQQRKAKWPGAGSEILIATSSLWATWIRERRTARPAPLFRAPLGRPAPRDLAAKKEVDQGDRVSRGRFNSENQLITNT